MRKAFNHYLSIHEIKKQLNDEQYVLFDKALCGVQFLEIDIDTICFKDPMLNMAWTSIKHTINSNIEGYCSKMKINYKSLFYRHIDTPCQPPLQPPCQQEKEKEKEKEEVKSPKGCRLENLPKSEKEDLYSYMKNYCNSNSIQIIEIEKFKDYWLSVTTIKAIKKDWKATFRNWCRSDWVKKETTTDENGFYGGYTV